MVWISVATNYFVENTKTRKETIETYFVSGKCLIYTDFLHLVGMSLQFEELVCFEELFCHNRFLLFSVKRTRELRHLIVLYGWYEDGTIAMSVKLWISYWTYGMLVGVGWFGWTYITPCPTHLFIGPKFYAKTQAWAELTYEIITWIWTFWFIMTNLLKNKLNSDVALS